MNIIISGAIAVPTSLQVLGMMLKNALSPSAAWVTAVPASVTAAPVAAVASPAEDTAPAAALAAFAAPPCEIRSTTPYTHTAAIGPIEAIPVSPKLSSDELSARPELFFADECLARTAATPTPSAMMNGTVIGPVVAPPASNATP